MPVPGFRVCDPGYGDHVTELPDCGDPIAYGIVIETDDGERFVDAPEVGQIFERCVLTTLAPDQVGALPRGEHGPPAYRADPALGAGHSLRDYYLRTFRKGGWLAERSGEEEMKK